MAAMSYYNKKRVFVLVDRGKAQGVFSSFDEAEAYADKKDLSLDRLLEYLTHPDHPDHLHLMAAYRENGWEFVGEWTKQKPSWKTDPEKVRLDHYHLRKGKFELLRQMEFPWKDSLLARVNPMAPDSAMIPEDTIRPKSSPSQWKPKLSPLKSTSKPQPPPADAPVESGKRSPEPLMTEDSDPEPPKDKHKLGKPGAVSDVEKKADSQPSPSTTGQAKGIPRKSNRLRLKSDKAPPKPIPVFTNTASENSTGEKSTVELAQMDLASIQGGKNPQDGEDGEKRKIIPLRLIIPVVAIFICWGLGIFYVFRPEPTAQKMLPEISTLTRADVLIIEPGQIFFQLPVDPVNQHRWVRNLELDPVLDEENILIPTMHSLRTWEKPSGFIRPPYGAVEVREWWDLRLRTVQHGFHHQWDDGSIIILDLESDMMIGWANIRRLPELLN